MTQAANGNGNGNGRGAGNGVRGPAGAPDTPATGHPQHGDTRQETAAGSGRARHRRAGLGRLLPFRRPGHKGEHRAGHHGRTRVQDLPPDGLAASLMTSGGMLLAMVEDVRMRETTAPADLRALADAFARHNAAKEATVRKVLDRHQVAGRVVARDRQEGTLIQDILDRALVGRHPSETQMLTVDGGLAQMYQYLFHERRDLVPALQDTVPRDESVSLAAAFQAIDQA